MKARPLLALTALVSSVLGAIAVYLVLSVPNDLRADSLLKEARQAIEQKQPDQARQKLSSIIQQYPRTDAAAAATVALMTLADNDRRRLEHDLAALRTQNAQQSRLLSDLQKSISDLRNAPPKVVTVQAPAPAPKPTVRKPTARKSAPARRKTTRRRR